MGSGPTGGRRTHRRLLEIGVVVAICFAGGLVAAGTVAGAGPLGALTSLASATDDTSTATTGTTTTDPTNTDPTDTQPTDTIPSETTDTQTASTLASGPPTLVSDRPDYSPGDTVTLTGENWAPAEVVHVTVNDDQEKPWTYQADVVASASGTIWHQFQLPITFAASYAATATGPLSGTATTTFTDGNVKARTNASGFTFQLDWIVHNGTNPNPTRTCNSSSTTSGSEPAVGFSGGAQFSKGVASNSSIILVAANTSSDGRIFTGWSGETAADTFDPRPDPHEICVTGDFTGNRTYVANYAANTPPTVAFDSPPTTANEGQAKTYNFTITDPNAGDTFTFVAGFPSCGTGGALVDGSATINSVAKTGTFQCSFADGPTASTVQVRIKDSANAESNTASQAVTVANVPPSIAISGAASVNEGSSYSLTLGAVTDPGTDTVSSYVVHWGDGNTDSYSSNGAKTHTYADGSNNYAITVDLVDEDGTHLNRANALAVQVDNVAPSIAISGAANVNEGSAYSLTLGAVTDPGTDTVSSYVVHWGDGNTDTYSSNGVKSHTYADGPATRSITVDLVDEDGTHLNRANALSVQVDNVPPTVTLAATNTYTWPESATAQRTFDYSASDPAGANDPLTMTIDCGTGGDFVTGSDTGSSFKCRFPDGPASPTVSVSANDGDGGVGSDSRAVTVNNVPPTVTLAATNTYTWPESATAQRTFDYSASDPAGANDPLTMTIDCGTGGDFVTGSDTGSSFKCRFPDGPASPTVSVSANDGDGGVGSDSHAVTVNNVVPTVAKPTFQPVLIACQTSTVLTGISFSDPGVSDNPWNVDIDWGDASTHTTYMTAAQGNQPNQSHTYSTPGPHTATVTVTDKDGGSGSNTSTAPVTVFQYTVDFLPPFDDSTPSELIVNKMKNGRVVPVKARIRDECAGALVTGPGPVVTIKVSKTSGSGTGDPIEEYADAGESSAGTDEFRGTSDYWIYNLDSKALGLVINNFYRVDVYVAGVKATVSNWAVLQPVK